MTKSVTKLAQRHSVWTSYRASYPTLRIYDEIWLFVMDVVWSVTKSENIMGILSWIKGFLVVYCGTWNQILNMSVSRALNKMNTLWIYIVGRPLKSQTLSLHINSMSSYHELYTSLILIPLLFYCHVMVWEVLEVGKTAQICRGHLRSGGEGHPSGRMLIRLMSFQHRIESLYPDEDEGRVYCWLVNLTWEN
jgi:hypothetical protein